MPKEKAPTKAGAFHYNWCRKQESNLRPTHCRSPATAKRLAGMRSCARKNKAILLIQSRRKSIHLQETAKKLEQPRPAWSRETLPARLTPRPRRSGHRQNANKCRSQRSVRHLANGRSRCGQHHTLPENPDCPIRLSIQQHPSTELRRLSSQIHPIPEQRYWKMSIQGTYPDQNPKSSAKPTSLSAFWEFCMQEADALGAKQPIHPAPNPAVAAANSVPRRRAVQS